MPLPSSPRFSTLELARHDASAGAPERDHAIVAPENARELDAPQVAFMSGLETFYSSDLPEVVDDRKNEVETQNTNHVEPAPHLLSRRLKIISVAVTVAIIAALALGVGLGERMKHKNPRTVTSSVSSAAIAEPTILPRQILADTSLAVAGSPNGDGRLFFQDQSGTVRETIYSA
ncbi:MAG: hypothetical protein Q9191_006004 [Dirinaria sp. TL-2023a]